MDPNKRAYNQRYYKKNRAVILEACKLYGKKYYQKNKVAIRQYRQGRKEALSSYFKQYYQDHKVEKARYSRQYFKDNKATINHYNRTRHRSNVQVRLSANLRNRLNHALGGNYRKGSAVRDLGCTIGELKIYLEKQFLPGMSWNNWEHAGWHIDHIIPLSSFDLTDRKQFLQACHYTNLQPLWATANLSKGARLPPIQD